MELDKFFKLVSYIAVLCGFCALWVSGTLGISVAALFVLALVVAWLLEGTRWQITERPGTALIVAAIPFYYAAWRAGLFEADSASSALPGFLAKLILTLSAIKLLQKKSDRDWVFLYLMAFFQVLLAAGLSISPLYLAVFVAYIFAMVCSVILLEMRRSRRLAGADFSEVGLGAAEPLPALSFVRKIPLTAFGLLLFTVFTAGPIFFMLPRVGAAGAGGPGMSGVSTYSGFADSVRLGRIGQIQESNEVVMRVRVEGAEDLSAVRWRGVALDTFDNRSWSKSNTGQETRTKGDRDIIQVDYASGREGLALQTVYLEPLDSPVLFGMPRPVGVQGNFSEIYRDNFNSIFYRRPFERISYRVVSDTFVPSPSELRSDDTAYPGDVSNYLQLPAGLDPRIAALAAEITKGVRNRYDASVAVESFLQNSLGYTLEQRAAGDQPLADFLFNVKAGHCEYFSTAMAVMLRTQGIATRVVNGFQRGEYNEMADLYVVRQKNAHSWVEVYFPGEKAWVTFDPTPLAGREAPTAAAGIGSHISKYTQALEAFWIEYFVAFDIQEQRSLYLSIRRGFSDLQRNAVAYVVALRSSAAVWWSEVRGGAGLAARGFALAKAAGSAAGAAALVLLVVWMYRKIVRSKFWHWLRSRLFATRRHSIVEFYDQMLAALESKGFRREPHQTPLEYASGLGMPEAVLVTKRYNDVRFGGRSLSGSEAREIEHWLAMLSASDASQ